MTSNNDIWNWNSSRYLQHPEAQIFFYEAVATIPSAFGRLAYISSLRDPQSGYYHHARLSERFGVKETNSLLERLHTLAFEFWLTLALAEQKSDLATYLSTAPEPLSMISRNWLRIEPYRSYVPDSAEGPSTRLYFYDLNVVLRFIADVDDKELSLPATKDWRINKIVQLIEVRFGNINLTLKDLGKQFRFSERYLGSLFKHHVGITFRHYLRDRRLKKAADLLSSEPCTFQTVATLVGYSDTANFHRDFKAFFGLTPAKYKERALR